MDEFIPLIRSDEVPEGKSVRVRAGSRYVIVCNERGRYHVADCVCPHEGGPLADADVRDGCVVCPVHYWPWDLQTGLTDANMPELRLPIYPCEVRDDTVFAAIPSATPRPPFDLDCRDK